MLPACSFDPMAEIPLARSIPNSSAPPGFEAEAEQIHRAEPVAAPNSNLPVTSAGPHSPLGFCGPPDQSVQPFPLQKLASQNFQLRSPAAFFRSPPDHNRIRSFLQLSRGFVTSAGPVTVRIGALQPLTRNA
jgi:hypothetical protein